MSKRKSEFSLPGLIFDKSAASPLYLQVYEAVRKAILDNRLRPGEQLPPTREFAATLGISRTTVLLAFDHLLTEGYITGKTGSGTFVSETIPEKFLEVCATATKETGKTSRKMRLSERGMRMAATANYTQKIRQNLRPFRPGIPALREFPFALWSRLSTRQLKSLSFETFGYGNSAGYQPLREALANYLRISRAVRCEPAQVIITNGSQQAIDLVSRVVLGEGDYIWMEEPGYSGAGETFVGSGVQIAPVPLDSQGLLIKNGRKICPDARLAYVTPSHQYPLGMTMSLPRRIELLEWAVEKNAWVLEDDYDSEYRYTGHPISSLQGLDHQDCVIYMGTFSKVLFPGLSLGYLVAPSQLVDALIAARSLSERSSPILEQATLTAFIEEGHFGRHIRQMRVLYQERQEMLIENIRKYLDGVIKICPAATGLQLTAWLNSGDDRQISQRAAEFGLDVRPLSIYYADPKNAKPGIVFGYAAFNETEIKNGIITLAKIMKI